MNTMFDDRERAFEAKFAHDEDFKFRVHARRDKLFAHWAGERLGFGPEETDALVAAAVHIPDRAGHDAALVARIGATLAQHGHPAGETELRAVLNSCEEQARAQLLDMSPEHPPAV